MKLPRLPITSSNSLTKAETFGGLNKTDTYVFGELSDCKNITSDNYPALASRKGRFIAPIMGKGKVLGCGSGEEFYYVYNEEGKSYFVYGGVVKGEWEDTEAKEKSFAEIGRTIYIFPDKKFYRCVDKVGTEEYLATHPKAREQTEEICYMRIKCTGANRWYIHSNAFAALKEDCKTEHEFGDKEAITNIRALKTDGTLVDFCKIPSDMKITVSGSAFDDVFVYVSDYDDMDSNNCECYSVRYSSTTYYYYYKIRYSYCVPEEYGDCFGSFKSEEEKAIIVVPADDCQYLYLDFPSELTNPKKVFFDNKFCEGMTVKIKNKVTGKEFSVLVKGVDVGSFSTSNTIVPCACLAIPSETFYEGLKWNDGNTGLKLTNDDGDDRYELENTYVYFEQPELTYVCSSNNRIWGCDTDTIYASALGKPWVYYQYSGTAADSWTVDVLSNGDFTAAFEYAGMPHFAKKDRIIKLYGTSPSTYQTSELICDGVLDGESVSLCGPCMYWLSENGVMRYTGSYPVKVSEKLGSGIISGIGAASSNKYYLYSGYADGKKALYVYDTEKGLWHSEDCGEIESAVCHDGKIYAISEGGIMVLYGNELLTDEEKGKYGFLPEAAFDSYAVLSDNYENTFYHKYVSKLIFRLQASEDAHIRFYLRYDNDEMKTLYYEYIGNGERDNIYIPIIPRRCDRYELSIEGEGEWKIISMARELSGGTTKKNIMR